MCTGGKGKYTLIMDETYSIYRPSGSTLDAGKMGYDMRTGGQGKYRINSIYNPYPPVWTRSPKKKPSTHSHTSKVWVESGQSDRIVTILAPIHLQ